MTLSPAHCSLLIAVRGLSFAAFFVLCASHLMMSVFPANEKITKKRHLWCVCVFFFFVVHLKKNIKASEVGCTTQYGKIQFNFNQKYNHSPVFNSKGKTLWLYSCLTNSCVRGKNDYKKKCIFSVLVSVSQNFAYIYIYTGVYTTKARCIFFVVEGWN